MLQRPWVYEKNCVSMDVTSATAKLNSISRDIKVWFESEKLFNNQWTVSSNRKAMFFDQKTVYITVVDKQCYISNKSESRVFL